MTAERIEEVFGPELPILIFEKFEDVFALMAAVVLTIPLFTLQPVKWAPVAWVKAVSAL